MRNLSRLLTLSLFSLPMWVHGTEQTTVGRAGQDVAVVRVSQQLAHSRAHVADLQKGVARQESISREASLKLQQKDNAIAELERQLRALKAGQKAPRDGD
ncbi:hypothetical protein [Dyella sp. A6]|uniref:hypothetical protein n=1 Tax=Dyella aluminiiresistens TaxID=3069105 RepID=UPI002E787A2A|nr:hypothetical protein [Dyella sp. A6]